MGAPEQPQETQSTDDLVRSPEVWFDDGTVVLRADSTIFRVYRGILSHNSSVFRDMFSIPQPDCDETYEGVPFVRLHDPALDLTIFLKALHDSSYYENTIKRYLSDIVPLLRMATKYDVPQFRHRVISCLAPLYPDTLHAWLDRDRATKHFQDIFASAVQVVRLARENDVPFLLPAALLTVSFLPLKSILDGSHKGVAFNLNEEDKKACVLGRQLISEEWRKLIVPCCMSRGRFVCQSMEKCDVAWMEWFRNKKEIKQAVFGLEWYNPLTTTIDCPESICKACSTRFTTGIEAAKTTLWDNLPQYFDLPTWPTMRELLKESLQWEEQDARK